MKKILVSLLLILSFNTQFCLAEKEAAKSEDALWDSLKQQTGEITLPKDIAKLNIPKEFYFLDKKDSRTLLVDIWKNPVQSSTGVLGMIVPRKADYAVTIEYEEDGHVSDDDANEIDYTDLLEQMKKDVAQNSKWRVKNGYSSISLVGWAAPPFYDKENHKLHWAQEIAFSDSEQNTLNYDIRILGRKGVLILTFIAEMDEKANIDKDLDEVLNIANFNEGSRYNDFDPSIDKMAAYGIGALVAGKVLAKTGIFIALLLLLKKFGIFLVIGVGLLMKKIFAR